MTNDGCDVFAHNNPFAVLVGVSARVSDNAQSMHFDAVTLCLISCQDFKEEIENPRVTIWEPPCNCEELVTMITFKSPPA